MISWKHFIFVFFLSLLFITKVNALTYEVAETNSYQSFVSFQPSWATKYVKYGVLNYGDSSLGSMYAINSRFETISSDRADNNPILMPGQYLVEFIYFGVGNFGDISCNRITSNFKNINMTSGSWVANEISSTCVDTYKTTYNGNTAYKILYSFVYSGTGANEFDFHLEDIYFAFISPLDTGINYGITMSNIYGYDTTIIDNFKTAKAQEEILNANKETNEKLETQIQQNNQAEETRKGMWETLKSMLNYINPLSEDFFAYKLVELMLNMLKSLFIPEDMDFVTNFVEALESKLGFIAAIPVKIIEFTMSLATATWSEFKSIQLPSISIFGYNFWNAQEIDLTEAINIFAPFKYVTDVICVVICAQTLNKWRERFTGGGAGK